MFVVPGFLRPKHHLSSQQCYLHHHPLPPFSTSRLFRDGGGGDRHPGLSEKRDHILSQGCNAGVVQMSSLSIGQLEDRILILVDRRTRRQGAILYYHSLTCYSLRGALAAPRGALRWICEPSNANGLTNRYAKNFAWHRGEQQTIRKEWHSVTLVDHRVLIVDTMSS